MNKDSCYSGEKSAWFWERVSALADGEHMSAIYAMGCLLQNVESYVLNQLINAEIDMCNAKIDKAKRHRTPKKK